MSKSLHNKSSLLDELQQSIKLIISCEFEEFICIHNQKITLLKNQNSSLISSFTTENQNSKINSVRNIKIFRPSFQVNGYY